MTSLSYNRGSQASLSSMKKTKTPIVQPRTIQQKKKKAFDTINNTEDRNVGSLYVSRKNLGRALYVDQAVNVVRPKSGVATSSKVKPGQMNLFNPEQKQNSTSEVDTSTIVSLFNKQSKKRVTSAVSDITKDYKLSKDIRASNIQQETMQVQEEFDQLMKEMVTSKIAAESDPSK